MSKFWKVSLIVAWLLIASCLAMSYWYWPAKVEEAYQRGCTDRDSLWISVMQKMTDKLAEQEFDASDTLPAVEE